MRGTAATASEPAVVAGDVVVTGQGGGVAEVDTTASGLGSSDADAGHETRRVLIAVPVFTHVEPRPFGNFLAMALRAGHDCKDRWVFDLVVPERQLIHGAMNQVAQTVMDNGHAGLLVFDDDCFPPYDTIPRLMAHAANGEDIVAGVGIMRGYPHTTTVGRYYPEGYSLVRRRDGHWDWRGFFWMDDLRGFPQGLVEVDFCGMPVMWISRKVLEAVEPPWFGTHLDGGDMTHDVYFAIKAKKAGFKIQVDTTIQCGHLIAPKVVDFTNRAEIRGAAIAFEAMRERPQGGAIEYLEGLAKEISDGAAAAQPV